MENNDYSNLYPYDLDSGYAPALSLNQYISRTFGWMFLGLLATFFTALAVCLSGLVLYVFANPFVLLAVTLLELAVVLIFSTGILKRPVGATRALFFAYAVLNGVLFSAYFVLFNAADLILIFGLTALFFGAFALYGRFTRTDLSGLRPLLLGGLIFLLIAGVLTLFLDLSSLERIVCIVGILIFLALTAYDTQKIKANYQYFYGDAVMLRKASVFSALQLYLDFINLFLYLLRFFGRSRNS